MSCTKLRHTKKLSSPAYDLTFFLFIGIPPRTQVLCGALDNLAAERDPVVLVRRIKSVTYVLRRCQNTAGQLVGMLGLDSEVEQLYSASAMVTPEAHITLDVIAAVAEVRGLLDLYK